ncbi:unnamed protein product [Phytophthora fragariaefolia]|uniref:Palmitoyltransferase n=1 Tax=Phytophthora fragariaefolia TaxID=1490495 RepID=A0A9W6X750_9STRA|nr:unnamed protein product [Phytophthora fragariaefolia]
MVITAWCICESRDPAKPASFIVILSFSRDVKPNNLRSFCTQKPASGCFPSILRVPHKETRYCGLCYKNSPGLDHHCTWLNTCIAECNYEAFYCLVFSSTCQTLLQTVIGILMCTVWQSEVKANAAEGWDTAVIALLWIHNASCVSLANSFILLAGFHTYLLCVGMGTYDFILANGSEGLCTRMLKCNCLRRKKARNRKRSHIQHGNIDDTKSSKSKSRRGSPPAAITPANLSSPSSLCSQSSLEHAAATAALEVSRNSERAATSRVPSMPSPISNTPTEVAGSVSLPPSMPDMVISVGVNESEGIFEEVDLNSPPKPIKSSRVVVAPAIT